MRSFALLVLGVIGVAVLLSQKRTTWRATNPPETPETPALRTTIAGCEAQLAALGTPKGEPIDKDDVDPRFFQSRPQKPPPTYLH